MTALARLLARASGQAATGLRPRLSARFEAGAGDDTGGFETITEETTAPATIAPAPSVSAGPSARQGEMPSPQPSTPTDAAPSSRRLARAPGRSPRSAPDPRSAPHTEPPSPLLPETAVRREPQPPGAPPDATPAIETTSPTAQAAGPDPAPQPRQTIDPTRGSALGPMPERLQPLAPADPQPAPHEMHFDHAIPATTPRRAGAADAAAPAPPDITVHIGRLHVVAQPAKPRIAPERPQPRRAAATLGDYLRGKEDAP